MVKRIFYQLGGVCETKFILNMAFVRFYRFYADKELIGDISEGLSTGNHSQYFFLTPGQFTVLSGRKALSFRFLEVKVLKNECSNFRAKMLFPFHYRANGC